MTELLMIALVLGVFLHDALLLPSAAGGGGAVSAGGWLAGWPWYAIAAVVIVPKVLVAGIYAWGCRRTLKRLSDARSNAALRGIGQLSRICAFAALPLYVLDLACGGLDLIRSWIGNPILIDELAIMVPTVALLLAMWWLYYPIERRLRESAVLWRADRGLPIHPLWTRGQFILTQARHRMALMLVPLLMILAWSQLVTRMGPDRWGWVSGPWMSPLAVGGALGVFLFAPLVIRYIWDTVPLPPGEVRDRLLGLCRSHGVGVRSLLLWRTHGWIINAAVMGLIAPVRFILVTDALLEQMPEQEVEAVMAHELAHVKKHHIVWLAGAAIAALGLVEVGFDLAMQAIHRAAAAAPVASARIDGRHDLAHRAAEVLGSPTTGALVIGAAAAMVWVVAFGWVSRRVERQADAFAVRHMAQARQCRRASRDNPEEQGETSGVTARETPRNEIDPLAVAAMVGALQRLADLNLVPPHRRSWRHGSIAWRQDYLHTLIGRDPQAMPIDRQMRWIKLAILLALALAGGYAAGGGALVI